ncbi:restriction endonuclease subunit S [Paractinoplanes lichenicola]|uniref:Restriction endonuclease subunit S n=1 Tax=Paractinoplanes lichenicola TaxID=2802976 RepID=A0ABS1VUN3_9ACTN|nr:restriction endonuclease subunit S [Actinoplanes lichenicola]MBL7258160.1 restriction endonuclease subunit S [Actinoplanes lichenicola]
MRSSSAWTTQRLGRLAKTIGGSGFPHAYQGNPDGEFPFAKVSDLKMPANGNGLITAQNFVSRLEAKVLGARVVPIGSIVFPKVGAALLGNARSLVQRECLIDNNMMAVVPNVGDSRYWLYLLSVVDLGQLVGGGPLPFVSESQVRDLQVWNPPIEEQRRIADFLDGECSRMGKQREAFVKLRALVEEREGSVLEASLIADSCGSSEGLNRRKWVPLARLTDQARPIMYGIVLPGPNVDDGVPIVKGGDVAGRRLRVDALCKTTREIESGYRRSRLKGGDLVIAIRGSVGEVEVVPDELTGANLTQDAARISIGRGVDRRWLELVLRTPSVAADIQSRVTGATIKGINIWDLKRVLIPMPESFKDQKRSSAVADREISLHEQILAGLDRQLRLLEERRQALITMAVSGQIDVTTARGSD